MQPKYCEYENREEWINARKIVITSTDIGQILGVSKWGDRLKVYADKTGAGESIADNDRMTIGRHVQEGIAAAYAVIRERRGDGKFLFEHVPNYALYFHGESPTHAASMDCWQIEEGAAAVTSAKHWGVSSGHAMPLEIKSTGAYPDEPFDEWMTQVQWQMYVTGSPKATIAALCGGDDLRYWDVDRDEDLIAPMATTADAFIEQYLIPGQPPGPAHPEHSGKALRRIYAQSVDGTEVIMDMNDLDQVIALTTLKGQKKEVEASIASHENVLMAKMGTAEIAWLPNGQKITWRTSERKGYTVQPSTSRRFLIGKEPV